MVDLWRPGAGFPADSRRGALQQPSSACVLEDSDLSTRISSSRWMPLLSGLNPGVFILLQAHKNQPSCVSGVAELDSLNSMWMVWHCP